MTRRQAVLLRTFSLWTIYVFITLVWNIWHDHTKGQTGFGFKAVHFVLAAISITLAVLSWRVVTKVAGKRAVLGRREPDSTRPTTAPVSVPRQASDITT